ncbi:uncharacterized protein [Notothenia coriiceps]|uniref:Uncharacterized protein n=1 Tax=Notothenia coriiceps TaxID=8208 RepID=A0A6I9NCG9_9TELE|nr:PREDICTED: uncharacterized protein LOC104950590 [Notothenia coriiceps]
MSSSQMPTRPYKISHVTVVTKPAGTVSSAAMASHLVHLPSDSSGKTDSVLEVGELEGDTLDPQTGLFYRSSQPAADPTKQTLHLAATQLLSGQITSISTSTQPPPQLQSKPQILQPSSSSAFPSTLTLTKKLPKLREQIQPKLLTPSPKDRPLTAPAFASGVKVVIQGTPIKTLVTPQLPKLQQAPTSLHRPLHTPMSHPPPLQAHHPVSTEKTSSSQQPIITQSATVTKITSQLVRPSGEKPSVSDILKISMMEAEIDPSVEPMVVDSSSDCGPLGKNQAVTMDSGPFISSSGAHHSLSKGPKFSCMPGLTVQRSKEDMEVIEVIPQYSILPDSSQSNVVVEPSGFLEITNYTSQQLEEDSPMEQEVDSSTRPTMPMCTDLYIAFMVTELPPKIVNGLRSLSLASRRTTPSLIFQLLVCSGRKPIDVSPTVVLPSGRSLSQPVIRIAFYCFDLGLGRSEDPVDPMLNALLILLFVPIFDFIIYPLIGLCKINVTPLRKMAVGMIFAALAFGAATLLEIEVVKSVVDPAPAGKCLLQVFNLAEGDVSLMIPGSHLFKEPIPNLQDPAQYETLPASGEDLQFQVTFNGKTSECNHTFLQREAYSLILYPDAAGIRCNVVSERKLLL